jgi:hypothetical protein
VASCASRESTARPVSIVLAIAGRSGSVSRNGRAAEPPSGASRGSNGCAIGDNLRAALGLQIALGRALAGPRREIRPGG